MGLQYPFQTDCLNKLKRRVGLFVLFCLVFNVCGGPQLSSKKYPQMFPPELHQRSVFFSHLVLPLVHYNRAT